MTLWIVLAAANGVAALAAGSYGYHGLAGDGYQSIFQIGVRYHMWHALALLGVAWMADKWPQSRLVAGAGVGFQVGILMFSGSLYVMSLTGAAPISGVAPSGGFALIAGWVLIAAAAIRNREK